MSNIELNFSATNINNIHLNNVDHHPINNDKEEDALNDNIKLKEQQLNAIVQKIKQDQKIKDKKKRNKLLQAGMLMQAQLIKQIDEEKKEIQILNFEEKRIDHYHYLKADLDFNSGAPNLYSNKHRLFYTLENLYIVGPLLKKKSENATLILSFKSINDHNPNKPTIQYVCFPLNINNSSTNTNLVTGILNGAGNNSLSAIDLNELLKPPGTKKRNYRFEHFSPDNDMLDIDIYFFSNITNVYYDPNAKNNTLPSAFKWITADIQRSINNYKPLRLDIFMSQPVSENEEAFTTLWDWGALREPMETITATENSKMSQEEQIYIQCAPAGASEQTEMVHTNARKGKNKENGNLSFLIIATVVIVINILFVGLGYKMIYLVLSKFFVENVIESHGSKHADKRRGNPFEMLLYWIADIVPHFLEIQWGEGNKRTPSENLIRVFVYAFYAFLLLMILHSLKNRNMSMFHFALFVFLIYIVDIFFFFIQIRNIPPDQYQTLKEEKNLGS